MSRRVLPASLCSPVEQKLLKALRSLNWADFWPAQAGFFLEELGVTSSQAFLFANLIRAVLATDPEFVLLGPMSQFVSRDELNLLAALGHASRKSVNTAADAPELEGFVLLLSTCGEVLRAAKIVLKTRAVLLMGKPAPEWTPEELSVQPDRLMRNVKVVAVHHLTPRFRRIVLAGKSLADFAIECPAQWVKVFLPGPTRQQVGRAYTVRYFNAQTRELTLDIAIHDDGPLALWAEHAKPGDALQLAGPRGGFKGTDPNSWLLLAGDETGLPAIAAILEHLPAGQEVHVFIEVANAAEKQFLATQPRVRVNWIFRDDIHNDQPQNLKSVLRYSPLPASGGDAWVAAEASVIRGIRTQLLRERGFELGRVQAAGYWKQGEQDHRDLAAG